MPGFNAAYFMQISKLLADKNTLNLAVGQPDFKPSKCVLDALRDSVEEGTNYAPVEGLPKLLELIERKLKVENKVNAEHVVVTVGAVEALFDSMLAHLKRNDEVILFEPYYSRYVTAPNLVGAKVKTVGLKHGRPDLDALESKVTSKTKVIVLNTPSNPSAVVFSKEEVKRLADIANDKNIILISDEVYEKYVYDNRQHISPGQFSGRVITINSFSKTYGFPGLRLGYMAGSRELITPAANLHTSNTTCCPSFSQKAAIAALEREPALDLGSFDERRKLVMRYLDEAGANYLYPEGAFYVYVYVKGDSMGLANKLIEKKVLTMPSALFSGKNNAIRISYVAPYDKLEQGLKVFTSLL